MFGLTCRITLLIVGFIVAFVCFVLFWCLIWVLFDYGWFVVTVSVVD